MQHCFLLSRKSLRFLGSAHRKTEEKQQNAAENKENAEHADDQHEKERGRNRKSGRVAFSGMALGDMEILSVFAAEGKLL